MNFGTDYFQIRHGSAFVIGELTPSDDGSAWPATVNGGASALDGSLGLEIGTAVMRSTVDPTNYCVPASADMIGFLHKSVIVGSDNTFMLNNLLPKLRVPAKRGQAVAIVKVTEGGSIEVEGEPSITNTTASNGLLVTSGTGAITSNTSAPQNLSLQNGRWRLAQTGDIIRGVLRQQLTPVVAATNTRILIELRANAVSA